MLTLFYSPNACSMASHVALEEAGASFETKAIDIFSGEHLSRAYRAINARAVVPALRLDDGSVLLETTAILGWIGRTYLDGILLGGDALEQARTLATCVWLSGTVHPTFKRFVRPAHVVSDRSMHSAIKAQARDTYWNHLQEIDAMLSAREWVMGDRFTVADPYALVFYRWGRELSLPIADLANLAVLKDRVIERPAARRALKKEKSALLSM